jgi:PA domain
MDRPSSLRPVVVALALLGLFLSVTPAFGQATITIVNGNAPGVGFNDPTPAAPVGGNTGTTLGEQRLIAFQTAANTWGSKLASNVEVQIFATFEPLTCTATAAVLGSAGAIEIFSDFPSISPFPGPEFPNTWYHAALANKRAGFDLDPDFPDIRARFNVNLGLDNNHGTQIDLVTVLLHEFAHGLGFSQFASVTTGAQIDGLTDVYGRKLFDVTTNKSWDQMTDAERVASAINTHKVVWTGHNVNDAVPSVLAPGTPLLRVNSPPAIAGNYDVGTAAFGAPLTGGGVTGNVVLGLDPADATGPSATDACSPLTNASEVAGNIALVDRGTCGFVVKVKNAQDAGAIAVLVADNVAGSPPAGLGGADPTITIPSVRITLADGNTIKAQLGGGVNVTLTVDPTVFAGADPLGRALLYTPNPVAPGSTISHWDTSAFPNQLMEPAINADLTHSVEPPQDLTLKQLRDVGWYPDADVDGVEDASDCEPNSDLSPTVAIDSCNTGVPNTLFVNGCTINDRIDHIADASRNSVQFLLGVTVLDLQLIHDKIITPQQAGKILVCAVKAVIPRKHKH